METVVQEPLEMEMEPKRPEFLKILCILSFIACGLMILLYALGTACLMIDPNSEAVNSVWDSIVASNKALEDVDRAEFFHSFGIASFICLIANIVSLVGVIFMWRLEKIGFFIYAIAELSVNFFGMDMNMGQEKSYAGMIFSILIDVVFIVMYAVNLKYMTGKKSATA